MEFAQPPPNMLGGTPTHMPPPNMSMPPPNTMGHPNQGFNQKFEPRIGFINNRPPFRPFLNVQRPLPGPLGNMTLEDFDGKRLRKSVMRKTVDYNSSIIKALEVSNKEDRLHYLTPNYSSLEQSMAARLQRQTSITTGRDVLPRHDATSKLPR